MEIQLNGEQRQVAQSITVAQLLAEMDYSGKRLAVEINAQIVPRSTFHQHQLHAGDLVEIVQAIGGG